MNFPGRFLRTRRAWLDLSDCQVVRTQHSGINGSEIEKYYRDGHIREIAEYCESDVLNSYRVWLRYELFRGRLSEAQFQASEAGLVNFIKARGNTKPHLADLM